MISNYKKFLESIGNGGYASYSGGDETHQFWGNVAGGVLPYCLKTKRFLMSYRSAYVNEPHTWGIWGGKLDDDEVQSEIKDVVRREFREETGFDCNCFELVPLYIYQSSDGNFKYYNFLGLFEDEFTPRLDWETEKFKWMTWDELMKLRPKHFGLKELLKKDKDKILRFIV